MITEKETIKCEAVFNEERTHRFLWKQVWNKDKPLACVIMLNPCAADCLIYDTTTYLCVNNIASLEIYGGVEIVNIYSKLTSKLNLRWESDEELNCSENDTYIRKSAAECETVILACGLGAITNKRVQQRVKDVLEQLKPFSKKLYVITDGEEMRAVHPLTPQVRTNWCLEPFEAKDIKPVVKPKTVKPKAVKSEEQVDENSDVAEFDISADKDPDNADADNAESVCEEDETASEESAEPIVTESDDENDIDKNNITE